MSGKDITVSLEKRKQVGKGLGTLKREGKVPAVIHNHGKDSIIVSGDYVELSKVLKKAGKHHPVQVNVGDATYLTIIKDIYYEPKKHQVRHVVFAAIKQNETVETEVPIVFIGDAPAEKAGLIVIKQLDHVQLEAFPRDLPDEVTVSAESLVEIGDKITVADIAVQKGVKILTDITHTIATVEETPAQVSEEAAKEEIDGEQDATEDAAKAEQSEESTE
jgi:large subunit ribosomal protein L25